MRKSARAAVFIAAGTGVGALALLCGCQSKLIYFPRSYPAGVVENWSRQTHGQRVTVRTSAGSQTAFLQGNLHDPRRLWIVCGGNGTVALDWAEFLSRYAPAEDAYLLVDFPGYGESEGKADPARIGETLRSMLPAAVARIGWKSSDPGRMRVFGHSLGAAAVLMAAAESGISRGVLLSPFTSTMEMTKHLLGVDLGFLVFHRFDNQARLKEITGKYRAARFIAIHAENDDIIPAAMSRELAAKFPRNVEFRAISDGGHNEIPERYPAEISRALREIGE